MITQKKIQRDLFFLKVYAVASTLAIVGLSIFVFYKPHVHFREVSVERINVVEPDGTLKVVLSNKALQHPGVMDGITYEERRGQRPPGLMFFNEKGDELGGLVFDGNTNQGQGGSLTFDKFRGDQTIQLIHDENPDGTYFSGIKMNDQNLPLNELIAKQREISNLPTKEAQEMAWKSLRDQGLLMTERVRLGKDHEKASILKMKDAKGRTRIELKVEASGHAQISILKEDGSVEFSLPPRQK